MSAVDDQLTMTDAGRVQIFDTTLRDGEQSPEDDALREHDVLCRCSESAIKAGVGTVNLPDTVGRTAPEDFHAPVASDRAYVHALYKLLIMREKSAPAAVAG